MKRVPNHVGNENIFENFDSENSHESCYFSNDYDKKWTEYGPKLNFEMKEVRKYV